MRFRFRFRKPAADPAQSGHEHAKGTHRGRPRPKRSAEPPGKDPIKNWETPDQQFLRQAGDPFDG
jgi:hypothetical protein